MVSTSTDFMVKLSLRVCSVMVLYGRAMLKGLSDDGLYYALCSRACSAIVLIEALPLIMDIDMDLELFASSVLSLAS